MKYLTLLVFLGISLLCEAQQDSIVPFEKAYKRTYNIRKVSGVKPTIDGKLDEDFGRSKANGRIVSYRLSPMSGRSPNLRPG